ncbi:MAG: C2 family cysteine protease [Microcoleus sp.]
MALSIAFPLVLTDDPVAKYAEIAASLAPGARYEQQFDYTTVENPSSKFKRYLEDIYPAATITDIDNDLDSWAISQGSLGACGTFANIACYASIPDDHQYAIENGIYPLQPSSIGLYFVRICDPENPLGTKWMAIDSQVPTDSEMGGSAFVYLGAQTALLPALLTKAAATARGGCFDEITNHPALKQSFSWFPNASYTVSTFADFKEALEHGALCVVSMTQQYDSGGFAVKPSGVVYGHAFSIVDAVEATNPDGSIAQIVRIENPWGGGSDYVSEYSEDAPFWTMHPELSGKLADASATGGNYWVSWNQAKALTGKSRFELTLPLPHFKKPNLAWLRYEFDGMPVLSSEWWNWTAELIAGVSAAKVKTLTLENPATITFDVKWLNGSGARHLNIKVVDPVTGAIAGQFGEEVWWGGSGMRDIQLPAGTFKIYPCTRSYNSDRGNLQVMLLSEQPFILS